MLGTICLGLWATKAVNTAGANGLFVATDGEGASFLWKQVVALVLPSDVP